MEKNIHRVDIAKKYVLISCTNREIQFIDIKCKLLYNADSVERARGVFSSIDVYGCVSTGERASEIEITN